MLDRFSRYIIDHALVKGKRPVLAAVSGGIDSVVLVRLLKLAGIPFAIAHCNFGLRGRESDGDEKFVRALAAAEKVPFHMVKFDTETFAGDNKLGIQAAARKLRYDWFRKLVKENGYQSVATAHHADDLAETILLNLIRGTALAGYHGIKPVAGNVIRPLLFAGRNEISVFAADEKLKWRNDSSNDTDHYTRNKIRHHIMPLLQEINPSLSQTLLRNAAVIEGYEALLEDYAAQLRTQRVRKSGKTLIIDTSAWYDESKGAVLLFEWLRDLGFNGDTCRNLCKGILKKAIGNTYEGLGHVAVIEREQVIVSASRIKTANPRVVLKGSAKQCKTPFFKIRKEVVRVGRGVKISALPGIHDPSVAWLDAHKLEGDLEFRPWAKGDRFRPFGMKGSRLVSDFITDLRLTNQQKEQLYLLWSGSKIAWVAGYRIDDRFKIGANTEKAIKLTLEPF